MYIIYQQVQYHYTNSHCFPEVFMAYCLFMNFTGMVLIFSAGHKLCATPWIFNLRCEMLNMFPFKSKTYQLIIKCLCEQCMVTSCFHRCYSGLLYHLDRNKIGNICYVQFTTRVHYHSFNVHRIYQWKLQQSNWATVITK